jgi:hypothetical protein
MIQVRTFGSIDLSGTDRPAYIRGLLWNARGQPARAVDEFRKSVWSWSEGYTRVNYELARTLIAMKQPAQAVYPLQAALRGDLEASNLYLTRTDVHELLGRAFDYSVSATAPRRITGKPSTRGVHPIPFSRGGATRRSGD